MQQTIQFRYKDQLIELVNTTVTNECLTFENPSWRMEITQRDEDSFQIRIKHESATVSQDSFYYYCFCIIDKKSIFLLSARNLLTDEDVDALVVASFIKPMAESLLKQLRQELLHPFKDPDYLEKYIREFTKKP